jgi:PAS domain S-box-containing protein
VTDDAPLLRVLLVEDSADDAELVQRTLHEGGIAFEARLVASEAGFRRELEAFRPELVLADWALPGFSGGAAVAIAHAWDPAVPCILISGMLGEELVVEALRSGATDYVLKQRLAALVPAVRRAVAEGAARREHARLEDELAGTQAAMRNSLDAMADPFLIFTAIRDAEGMISDFRVVFANRAVEVFIGRSPEALLGRRLPHRMPDLRGRPYLDLFREVVETGGHWSEDSVEFVVPGPEGQRVRRLVDLQIAAYGDGLFAVGRDVTERVQADLEMRRLATAIEQSGDAIVMTDTTGAIEYVNPAFEQVTGYLRGEVLGQNPRILKSGVQGPAFYAAMWAALTTGNPFVGEMTNRRKDGSLFQEEAVITPVRDRAEGMISSYVAVKRNVTRERALEVTQARIARERALIAGTLADLKVLPTPAATADLICRQVASLTGVATCRVLYFALEDPAVPLAFIRADGVAERLARVPIRRGRDLQERAAQGPWVEAWVRRPSHPYDRLFRDLGVKALAHAPIRYGGRLIGLLSVSSADAIAIEQLSESMPALLEFAGFAGALLGPAIADLTEVGLARVQIARTIAERAFRPVFQPIVDLGSGVTVGYEALTRFSSGTRPDLVFAEGRSAGLEAELELATLAASVAAGAKLPQGAWLSLNVSPGLVVGQGRLAGLLQGADRPIVLELTEHVPILDYDALRAAIGRLRPEVRVAVDDAGAGVANFSHIVELRPAFVKVDIGLVRGIDADLTRQALMVGLLHFARESASQTIAEGVETEEELATLRRLGVPLAQGYLLGRPAPGADFVEPAVG